MRLFIHGIGCCGLGFDQPFADHLACLDDIPIADLPKPHRAGDSDGLPNWSMWQRQEPLSRPKYLCPQSL